MNDHVKAVYKKFVIEILSGEPTSEDLFRFEKSLNNLLELMSVYLI